MARQHRGVSTSVLLLFFLLLISCLVTGSLYLDLRHKNTLLEEKITQLEKSQVLLMVPEEQAQELADWMENNPEFTQSIIRQAEPGSQVRVEIGQEVPEAIARHETEAKSKQADDQSKFTPLLPEMEKEAPYQVEQKVVNATDNAQQAGQGTKEAVKLSEDKDGVKVISLPHGGIRVTTREDN